MDNSNNQGSQSRFLIAAVLSMVVLLGWTYFYAPKTPPANSNTNANTTTEQTAQPQPTAAAPVATPQPAQPIASTPDTTPARSVTIKTPLYEVTLDSKGATATSWIIVKNKGPKGDFPVYADGSNNANEKPLQLISQEGLQKSPREVPFLLSTADTNLNSLVNERNYEVSVPDQTITLGDGQQQQIDFTLTDASGVSVKKSFVFRGDSYVADMAVTLTQNGQPVPNTRLVIGPSIGDHSINHHN